MHSILLGFLLCVPLVSSVALYEQCGGEGYTGLKSCDWPLQCFRRSRWFSSCQVSCPGADWECAGSSASTKAPALASAWGQCGGEGWTGATSCAEYPCYARSRWYSQCRPDCPADWICSTTSTTTAPPTTTTAEPEIIDEEVTDEDVEELELYDPDEYDDEEELETDDFPDPSEVDLDELQKKEEELNGEFEPEEEETRRRRRRNMVRATSCKANGKSGTCISTSSCKGTSIPGFCPGATNIQCCVSSGSSSSGSSKPRGGLCGNYAGSTISSIKGNGNVAYSVVKIKKNHLANPGSYSLGPTKSDNTMTSSTACAFDKMATAAKKSGVTITIASGFRTVARQQYFWNCYLSKRCNGGNLAARPGTSNHGRGVALDLNTNCGKQYGARPSCGGSRVYQWLYKNGHKYGFTRTVKSEPWHWEFRGVGVGRASFS